MSENNVAFLNATTGNVTPGRKSRTPQIAKTAPVLRRRPEEDMVTATTLDSEVADELLGRIEQLEGENRKLRKIASKGKGATEALRTALTEVQRQQRLAGHWMAAAVAQRAKEREQRQQAMEEHARQQQQLKDKAEEEHRLLEAEGAAHAETKKALEAEKERGERLLERTRQLERSVGKYVAHAGQLTTQAEYFALTALKLQRALEGDAPTDEDFAALKAALESSLAFSK